MNKGESGRNKLGDVSVDLGHLVMVVQQMSPFSSCPLGNEVTVHGPPLMSGGYAPEIGRKGPRHPQPVQVQGWKW